MVTLNASRTERPKEHDRLFAEFFVSAWTEPARAGGHDGDPVAALAGFGVHLHSGEEAPEPSAGPVACEVLEDLVIEDLDHPAPVVAAWTYCG
ncbi:hypothetical protein [Streptosporangium sp. LJ11]|uniref:hypothetical protein n=1 Tax=Streptosporangium sp. LJ11 TaxID=3436927 RepID=UPI003F7AEE63